MAQSGSQQVIYFVPRCDIVEQQDGVVLLADVPGAEQSGIDINVEKGVLTILAHVPQPDAPGQPSLREYREGDYRKVLRLSDELESENIQASLKDGVLRVTIPKSQRNRPKKIEVRAG